MGLEALSRGATKCIFVERHFPTVRIIRENVLSLDPDLPVDVNSSDTFFWVRQFLKNPDLWPSEPWVVFCCPPYALYVEKPTEIVGMVESLMKIAPPESVFVVESDSRFDPELLPESQSWFIRKYAPALVAVRRARESGGNQAMDETS